MVSKAGGRMTKRVMEVSGRTFENEHNFLIPFHVGVLVINGEIDAVIQKSISLNGYAERAQNAVSRVVLLS